MSSFERGPAITLPVRRAAPETTADELAGALEALRIATSAPVTVRVAGRRIVVSRTRIAQLLRLPARGETRVRLNGPQAESWLSGLARRVNRPPRDGSFAVASGAISVVPALRGQALDVAAARRAIE